MRMQHTQLNQLAACMATSKLRSLFLPADTPKSIGRLPATQKKFKDVK